MRCVSSNEFIVLVIETEKQWEMFSSGLRKAGGTVPGVIHGQ